MNTIDLNDPHTKMLVEDGIRVVSELKNALVGLKPRVTEYEFVNKYLPILTARNLKDSDGNVVPVDMNHWFAVAGNAFTAVDIIDNDGKVLFEVPPINRAGPTSFHNRAKGTMSLNAVGDMFPKLLEFNPRGNIRLIADEYFKRYGHTDVSKDAVAWMEILERYNLLHTLRGVDAPVEVSNTELVNPTESAIEQWEDF